MIINRSHLLKAAPIKNMLDHKVQANPTSYGLTECGYDIRIKQQIIMNQGDFILASTMEEFDLPDWMMGQVLNKSTWARLGLDASATTNLEPKWKGFLTLELHYRKPGQLIIPLGCGIAQVVFHQIMEPSEYAGKYQNQEDQPVPARMASSELVLPDTRPVQRQQPDPTKRGFTPN